MSIDSAKKRRAISGIPFGGAGVTPNSNKDQDWRFSAAWNYIGFLYGVDNAEKRRAVAGLYPFLPVGVTPNASQDENWRRQAGWGLLLDALVLGIATLSDSRVHAASLSDEAYYGAELEMEP